MNHLDLFILVGAVVLGGGVGIFLQGKITMDVKVLLAFSGAYLFALAILHLMPEIYHLLGEKAGLYILLGFILQIALDYFSKGIEHGHIHHIDKSRVSFPVGIYVSLLLHSLIEGLPLAGDEMMEVLHHSHGHGHGGDHNHNHTQALLIGIAVHKIPEALALAALLFHHYGTKLKAALWLIPYALATPMGMWVGKAAMKNAGATAAEVYGILLSIAVGIFIHVSTTIIFEADEHHRFNVRKTIAILLGLALVWLSTAI